MLFGCVLGWFAPLEVAGSGLAVGLPAALGSVLLRLRWLKVGSARVRILCWNVQMLMEIRHPVAIEWRVSILLRW